MVVWPMPPTRCSPSDRNEPTAIRPRTFAYRSRGSRESVAPTLARPVGRTATRAGHSTGVAAANFLVGSDHDHFVGLMTRLILCSMAAITSTRRAKSSTAPSGAGRAYGRSASACGCWTSGPDTRRSSSALRDETAHRPASHLAAGHTTAADSCRLGRRHEAVLQPLRAVQ